MSPVVPRSPVFVTMLMGVKVKRGERNVKRETVAEKRPANRDQPACDRKQGRASNRPLWRQCADGGDCFRSTNFVFSLSLRIDGGDRIEELQVGERSRQGNREMLLRELWFADIHVAFGQTRICLGQGGHHSPT